MKVNTGSSVNVNKGQTAERTNNAPNQVSEQKKSVQKSDSINSIAQSLAAESEKKKPTRKKMDWVRYP